MIGTQKTNIRQRTGKMPEAAPLLTAERRAKKPTRLPTKREKHVAGLRAADNKPNGRRKRVAFV